MFRWSWLEVKKSRSQPLQTRRLLPKGRKGYYKKRGEGAWVGDERASERESETKQVVVQSSLN